MLNKIAKKFKKIVLLRDELDALKNLPTLPAPVRESVEEKGRQEGRGHKAQEYIRDLIFASNVTALAAKLAKCDGPITLEEIENFQTSFTLPEIKLDYNKLFAEAADDKVIPEHYAGRINTFFGDEAGVIEGIFSGLFSYAACDGPVNFEEIIFLKKISLALGLGNDSFKHMLKNHMVPKGADAFEILSVDKKISAAGLKKAYRDAVQLYHPDRLALAMPIPEVVSVANERIATINDAYKKIMERRNF